ncbi:MAG: methylated-DNA--[protein]-cysteine S-methyltransferase [Candidatus Competibacterales bacterium]|nr:methylated-DNA--[protein]-cysteine S-methyltransferase [Candidatus Competibacterales bacterium]
MPSDYARIARAIRFLEQHRARQPTLAELAAALDLSPFHCQRLFRRWAGVSPKRFLQCLTVAHAKRLLHASRSVLDASLDSGLSGPGRLHDHFVALEAVTPGEYRSGGRGLTIAYGHHEGPFGQVLVAVTERGVCGLSFCDEDSSVALAELRRQWPAAELVHAPETTAATAARLFEQAGPDDRPLSLLVRGSNFQVSVWRALLRIPPGTVRTYGDLADAVGRPGAARAVGQAVGANPVAWLIPCHRVIRASGAVDGYRWGTVRKKAMLARETARAVTREPASPGQARPSVRQSY